jgi:hypothetical protein
MLPTKNSNERREVERAGTGQPCPLCGTSSNQCFWSAEEPFWLHCYRESADGGVEKVDAQGSPYWRYRLDAYAPDALGGGATHVEGSDESSTARTSDGAPARPAARRSARVEHRRALADPDVRHRVYGEVLGALDLSETHRAGLINGRRLPPDAVGRLGYASRTPGGVRKAVAAVVEKFGAEVALGCPGIYGAEHAKTESIEKLAPVRRRLIVEAIEKAILAAIGHSGQAPAAVVAVVRPHAAALADERPVCLDWRSGDPLPPETKPMSPVRAEALADEIVGAVGGDRAALLEIVRRLDLPMDIRCPVTVTDELGFEESILRWTRDAIGHHVAIAGRPGLVIPVRDERGRITSLLLRPDWTTLPGQDAGDRPKYYPLTALTADGAPFKQSVHVALRAADSKPSVALVVEGPLKADIVQALLDVTGYGAPVQVYGLPGAGALLDLPDMLREADIRHVIVALDADAATKASVAAAQATHVVRLSEERFDVAIATWLVISGKGPDDLVAAGSLAEMKLLFGVRALAHARDCLVSAKAPANDRLQRRIVLHGVVERVRRDRQALTPDVIRAIAHLDPKSDECKSLLGELKGILTPGRFSDVATKIAEARKALSGERDEDKIAALQADGKIVLRRGDQEEAAQVVLARLTAARDQLVYDEGSIYRYEPANGTWSLLDDTAVRLAISDLGEKAVVGPTAAPVKISEAFVQGAFRRLVDRIARKRFFADAPRGIAFSNGFVRVDVAKRKVELVPRSPDHRVRHAYPFAYAEGQPPTTFVAALRRAFVAADEGERDTIVDLLQEFGGAAITGVATAFDRGVILRGPGDDGKSTIAEILRACAPVGSTCSINPQDLGNEYYRASLAGRLLNIVEELPERELLDTGSLKNVVTGGELSGREPTKSPFYFASIAAHLFCCNTLPKVSDRTKGFRRRFVILVATTVPESMRTPRYAQTILEQERESIVCWCIDGLRRLVERGHYALPASSERHVAEWVGAYDSLGAFLDEEVVELPKDVRGSEKPSDRQRWTSSKDFYRAYATWCREGGQTPLSRIQAGRRLREQLGLEVREGHREDGSYFPVELKAAVVARGAHLTETEIERLTTPEGPVGLYFVDNILEREGSTWVQLRGADGTEVVARLEADARPWMSSRIHAAPYDFGGEKRARIVWVEPYGQIGRA